jgi:hypothetical protein
MSIGSVLPGGQPSTLQVQAHDLRFASSDRPVAQRPTRPSPPTNLKDPKEAASGQVPSLHEDPTGVYAGPHTHVLLLLRRPMVPIGR